MLEPNTFLTVLYVVVDDYGKRRSGTTANIAGSTDTSRKDKPGPRPSLSPSEVITLALYGQWGRFRNETAFYWHVRRYLLPLFPRLPHQSQFNRLLRAHEGEITALFLEMAEQLDSTDNLYEALDGTAIPVRNVKRRGSGWLDGQADIGLGHRIGWYEGFYLLVCVAPGGHITGFGFAPASHKDQTVAETFFWARHTSAPGLPGVGKAKPRPYLVDMGFEGRANHLRWRNCYQTEVICPPKSQSRVKWSKALRQWAAGHRQIVETVIGKLQSAFRLDKERPHHLSGMRARLAAKMALHNVCIWFNRQLGRPDLAFADLVAW